MGYETQQRHLQIISFTLQGNALAEYIAEKMKSDSFDYKINIYSTKKDIKCISKVNDVKCWAQEQLEKKYAILFIGACGIAVRVIAPFIENKLTDSPVMVMDEKGQFIIPILSGHMGGANEIALQLEKVIGCKAVITTATDVQGKLAIDLFAKNHDLTIENRDGIAKISQKVLEHKKLTLSVAKEYENQVDIAIGGKTLDGYGTKSLLTLIPKEYILGIGCRRGKKSDELELFVLQCIMQNGIVWEQIKAIATIEQKAKEEAVNTLSKKYNVPVLIYSSNELSNIEGSFTSSKFVEEQVGVDNVCERAAIAACEGNGQLIQKKQKKNGMTIAIAKTEWRLTLYEE